MLVAKTTENLKQCMCRKCPSYSMGCKIKSLPSTMFKLMDDLDNVDHFEGMFCAFEKSHCIDEDKGCMCEECPVHAKYDLVREEYCFKTGGEIGRSCVMGFDKPKKSQK